MSNTILVLTLGLPLMLLLRVPLAFAVGLATIGALWTADIDMMIFAQRMVSGTQSFSLLAIPFFILAGDLMTAGGISRRLVGFADVLVRHRTGGLGMVAVLAAAFFAALSGSAPATTAAIGAIMIPEMEKRGYSRAFATALAVAGGIIGPMLPPSIPMVVWGVMSETSISDLFLAGIAPGILLALGLMVLCWNHARKHEIAAQPKATRAEVWAAFNAAKWALCGPIIVLGGIYGGIVTPTEAAIVAAAFAIVLGFGVYRELTLQTIVPVTRGSLKTMTIVMFIIALANGFGWVMAFEQLPGKVTHTLDVFADTPMLYLLMVNLLLLVIGCVMDNLAAMIILASFLVPIGEQLGMDPVQFGAMVAINFTIGMATPPFGYTIFVGAAISGLRIGQIARPLMPMLGVMIGVLLLVAFVPPVTLTIVELLR
ncbi:TRAP transporter large permease [Roseovarius sp. 217]|uniref:TRAP transporter large permease n=1 Tax=Roseovarius sp. (strain 217) TaxID=314264 RepID=UPI000068555C|nr:TRAP transporter large permease [Roseovarius sp. 217]EAQ24745.1 C4-dicarboxylate transport system (permease large protein) [Roseovarius sp. 217]